MPVLLRGAGRRDLDAIHDLWRARRDAELKLQAGLAAAGEADALEREHRELVLADPRTRFIVAEERGKVLGFAHAQIESNDLAYLPERYGVLVDLFVREEQRGQGLARKLLEQVDDWLRSRGIRELRARVLEADADAHSFLAHVGGRPLLSTFRREVPGDG